MDAHYPYVPKDEYDCWGGESLRRVHDELPDGPNAVEFLQGRPWGELQALEPLYDGCIRQIDAALERLINKLDKRDELEETLLIITSDHGEGFGERSQLTPAVRYVDHSFGLGEVLTHVPLLVKAPGQQTERRITEPASLTLFPAVARAAVKGKQGVGEFVPDDGRVLSSTRRIEPPGEELPLEKRNRGSYFGPWRAVYEQQDGSVLKHATRRNDAMSKRIINAQTSYRIDTDVGIVDETFDKINDAGVKQGDEARRTVDNDVEDRLEGLGYMR
jgi:arylsulfatase A-like enzyme